MHRTISRKNMIAGLAAAGVLGLGIAAPSVAFASDGSPAPSASNAPSSSPPTGDSPADKRGQGEPALAAALAKQLGLSQDKVTAALQKLRDQHQADQSAKPQRGKAGDGTKPRGNAADRQAQLKQRLDQAVKDGKLTQDEADAVTKAVDDGVLPVRGGPGHGRWAGRGRPAGDGTAFAAALAKELGVGQDTVTAALQQLRDQHQAGDAPKSRGDGTKPQGNAADRQAQLKQRLDQAVKDGKLTQAQEDAITKAITAGVLPGAPGQGHNNQSK